MTLWAHYKVHLFEGLHRSSQQWRRAGKELVQVLVAAITSFSVISKAKAWPKALARKTLSFFLFISVHNSLNQTVQQQSN